MSATLAPDVLASTPVIVTPAERAPQPRRRRARLLWIAGACALLLHAAAALFLLHPPRLPISLVPKVAQPTQEAEVAYVQNDMSGEGDGAAGGKAARAVPRPPTQAAGAPPTPPTPPMPDLLQAKDGEIAPPTQPTPQQAQPGPDQQQQAERVSIGPDTDAGSEGDQAGGSADTPATPEHNANRLPRYPTAAARAGQKGEVDMFVHVLPDGTAGEVVIANSSGSATLDQTAEKTVSGWKFKPAKDHGKPVASDVPVRLNFVLH